MVQENIASRSLSGLKRLLSATSHATSRSWRPLLVVLLIVASFGLGYWLYVRDQLRQVHERHLRLLGNATDNLEQVIANTRDNGDNLIGDPSTLPTFLRQNPYVELQGRKDPRLLARSLADPEGKARAVLHRDPPRLEMWIQGLVEVGRQATVATGDSASEVLGRLMKTPQTALVKPSSNAGEEARVDLLATVEHLEVDLAVDARDLPLEPGPLSVQDVDLEGSPALLIQAPGRTPQAGRMSRRHYVLSAPSSQPGRLEVSGGLRVQFEDRGGAGPRAVLGDGVLRILEARRVLGTGFDLTRKQTGLLAPVRKGELGIAASEAECGLWIFQDGRPLERLGQPPAEEDRSWTRTAAHRAGRWLFADDGSISLELGYFQRRRLPERGLKLGSFCPPELRLGDERLTLTPEQQREVELLLRRLAEARGEGPSYREDLSKLEVALAAGDGEGAGHLELTASYAAEPVEPRLSLEVREALQRTTGATLLQLDSPSRLAPAPFLLSVIEQPDTSRQASREVVRVPLIAEARQEKLLARILGAPEPELQLVKGGAARVGGYRLQASGKAPRDRLPLVMADGEAAPEKLELPATETLGSDSGAGWSIRLGGAPAKPGTKDRPALAFTFDLESVLTSPRLDAAFSSYFLADESGAILFHRSPASSARVLDANRVRHRSGLRFRTLGSSPASARESGAGGGGPAPSAEITGTGVTSTIAGVLADLDLRLTCQPTRLQFADQALVWRLCGQVDRRRAISEALGSAPYLTFGLLVIVVLGIVSVPFFRFVLMGRNERLKRGSILLLLAGTWLALAIAAMVAAAMGRHQVLEKVLEGQLRQLASQVRSNLEQDLRESRQLLTELDEMAAAAFRGGEDTGSRLPGCKWLERKPRDVVQQVRLLDGTQQPRLGLYVAELRRKGLLRPFTSVFWLDDAGWQFAKATVGPENTPAVPVTHRSYYRAVAENQPWTAGVLGGEKETGRPPFLFLDTFRSITTGERSAALSIPSELPLERCGRSRRGAAVLTGIPTAVRAPVVSGPLGFAVIDADGRTLFHSRPGEALTTSFLQDIGEPDRLAALLVSRTRRQFDGVYQSRPHSLRVEPLFADASLPGARPAWWLITFYDKELPRTAVSEALLKGLVPTILTGLLLGLLLLLSRRRVLRDLWPTRGEADHYLFLGVAYLVVAAAQCVGLLSPSLTDGAGLRRLVLYTGLPVLIVLGSSILLHRERAAAAGGGGNGNEPPDDAESEGEDNGPKPGLLARGGARIRAGLRHLAVLLRPGRALARGIGSLGRKRVFSQRDSLAYVVGMILLWVALAVLPALAYFNNAWGRQLDALREHDVLLALEALTERKRELRSHLAAFELDEPGVLAERLADRRDVYLLSAAAELLAERQDRDLFQGWFEQPVTGARTIRVPFGRADRLLADLLADRLPIYNRAAQSLRFLGTTRGREPARQDAAGNGGPGRQPKRLDEEEPDFIRSGESKYLRLPVAARALVGGDDDVVPILTSGVASGRRTYQLLGPVLLVLLLVVALAVWVWYTANHICFSRVEVKAGDEIDTVIQTITAAAAVAPGAAHRVPGFLVVVTARAHYEALQALGEPSDLCQPAAAEQPAEESHATGEDGDGKPGGRTIVICKRLETEIHDKAKRQTKLATLRRLIKSPEELPVLLCPRDPWELLRPAMPGAAAADREPEFELDEEEAAIWSGVLRRVEVQHVAVPVFEEANGERPREEEYWVIWSNCTALERLAMIQLATESLLNPKQADVVASLGRRGIVRLEPALEFVDAGFRDFVRRFKDSRMLNEVESQARSRGWGGRRWIFGAVVVLAAASLFLTRPQLFNATVGLLGAIPAAIAALLALLGPSGGAGGGRPQA